MSDKILKNKINLQSGQQKQNPSANAIKYEQPETIFADDGRKVFSLEKASSFLNEVSSLNSGVAKDISISEKNALKSFYDVNDDGTITDSEKKQILAKYKKAPEETFKELEKHYNENFAAFDKAVEKIKSEKTQLQAVPTAPTTQNIMNDQGFLQWLKANTNLIGPNNSGNQWPNFDPRTANVPTSNISSDKIYANNLKRIKSTTLHVNAPQKAYEAAFKKDMQNFKNNFVQNKAKYESVAQKAGVPAELVAALHWREGGGKFDTYLHNGQKLGRKTTIYPEGILFTKWEDAAVDALKRHKTNIDRFKLNSNSNDIVAMCSFAETYNGTGYSKKGLISPYVYSGTNQYYKGKYTSDGNYDPNAVDKQLGVLAMLKNILDIKTS